MQSRGGICNLDQLISTKNMPSRRPTAPTARRLQVAARTEGSDGSQHREIWAFHFRKSISTKRFAKLIPMPRCPKLVSVSVRLRPSPSVSVRLRPSPSVSVRAHTATLSAYGYSRLGKVTEGPGRSHNDRLSPHIRSYALSYLH